MIEKLIDSSIASNNFRSFSMIFDRVIEYPESVEIICQSINKLSRVDFSALFIKKLYEYFKNCSKSLKINQLAVSKSVFELIGVLFPSSSNKIDANTFSLVRTSSLFIAEFAQEFISGISTLPANNYQIAFLVFLVAFSNNSDMVSILKPIFKQKIGINIISLSIMQLVANGYQVETQLNLKSIIPLFKSFTDYDLLNISLPLMLKCITTLTNSSNVKEVVPLVSFLSKKLKKDSDILRVITDFFSFAIEIPESRSFLKPISDELLSTYLQLLESYTCICANGYSISLTSNEWILNFITKTSEKLTISIIDSFLMSKVAVYTMGVISCLYHLIDINNNQFFILSDISTIINELSLSCGSEGKLFESFLILCYKCSYELQTIVCLQFLLKGLQKGSELASKLLLEGKIPFDFVFPELVKSFHTSEKCGLFVSTITSLIQSNIKFVSEAPNIVDNDTIQFSDSNFDSIPDFGTVLSPQNDPIILSAPTPAITLFCNIISNIDSNPDFFSLLPLAASSISQDFANDLVSSYSSQKRTKANLELIASYSIALRTLDLPTLYTIAQTFLLMCPGQAMLFLAVSLQRLPRDIILDSLQKASIYASSNPDIFGKMIALVSHSHPDLALTFTESFISTTLPKLKVFYFFRSIESEEPVLIAIFRLIGYCSIFIDEGFFANDFLLFSTKILNKHLTHQSKSIDLYLSALFAIRKLSFRLSQYQDHHPDHIFPFKDFLVQYVCSYYIDVGGSLFSGDNTKYLSIITPILTTLSLLLPLKPIRISDKHERSIELTSVILQQFSGVDLNLILKSATLFYNILVQTFNNLYVFTSIITPLFQSLLTHSNWKEICILLHSICKQWEKIKVSQGSSYLSQVISHISSYFVSILPLVMGEISAQAYEIVYSLIAFHCAIRNQILSLPRSIRPSLIDFRNLSNTEIMNSVCSSVSKHLLTSQIFEIINETIKCLGEGRIRQEHKYGAVNTIYFLYRDRGSEEFRYDTNIILQIARSSKVETENINNVLMEIIGLIATMRLYSIVSTILSHKEEFSDDFMMAIIQKVTNDEKITSLLLSSVSDMIADEVSDNNNWFINIVLPFLGPAMKTADNDSWVKLFMSVLKQKYGVNSPLFKVLFYGFDSDNLYEYAKYLNSERPLAFTLILNQIPSGFIPHFSNLCVIFASISEETSLAFLERFFEDIPTQLADPTILVSLEIAIQSIPIDSFSIYMDIIIQFIVQNICFYRESTSCIHLLLNLIDNEHQVSFFTSLFSKLSLDLENNITILQQVINDFEFSTELLWPVIPPLFLFQSNNDTFQAVTNQIKLILKILPDSKTTEILVSDCFQDNWFYFLKMIMTYIKNRNSIDMCLSAAINLCSKIKIGIDTSLIELISHYELISFEDAEILISLLSKC